MVDVRPRHLPKLTVSGLLRMQLFLAPLFCTWQYAVSLTPDNRLKNSGSIIFFLGMFLAPILYATCFAAFRLRGSSSQSMLIRAMRFGVWYSLVFGFLAWGPIFLVHESKFFYEGTTQFLASFLWSLRRGEMTTFLALKGFFVYIGLGIYRSSFWLIYYLCAYGFFGVVAGALSSSVVQILRAFHLNTYMAKKWKVVHDEEF